MIEVAWIAAIIIFVAVIVQSVAGFGLALVAMPLLVGFFDFSQAAALVALVGITSQVILILQYRRSLVLSDIKRLMIGSVIGIPVGVLVLKNVDQVIATYVFGFFLIIYSLYSLLAPQLPRLERSAWGYGFGMVSGLVTGAYNSGGPILAVYGDCRRWQPDVFRGNMQALIFVHSITVLLSHAAVGNLTRSIFYGYLLTVPAIALGIISGYYISRRLRTALFRKLVPMLLLLLGLSLLLS